jgi:hypothetical protein
MKQNSQLGRNVCLDNPLKIRLYVLSYGRRQKMKKKHISRKSQTDWDYVDKLRDKDIDFSESPEASPRNVCKSDFEERA